MLNPLYELAPIPSVKTSIFESKLFQAAALAALLVALCSAAAEAVPISCVSQSGAPCVADFNAGLPFQSNTWKFYSDPYSTDLLYTLEIGGRPTSNFSLDVRDLVTNQAALAGSAALVNFPDAVCIPTHDKDSCGLFQVFEVRGHATWEFGYRLTITWFANENPLSQPPDDGLNTILHAPNKSGVFTTELAEIDYDPKPTPVDPAIGGRADEFSTFGAFRHVGAQPQPPTIPEPASFALFGAAIGGVVYRIRRSR